MTEKSASVLWTGAGKMGVGKISTETGGDVPEFVERVS